MGFKSITSSIQASKLFICGLALIATVFAGQVSAQISASDYPDILSIASNPAISNCLDSKWSQFVDCTCADAATRASSGSQQAFISFDGLKACKMNKDAFHRSQLRFLASRDRDYKHLLETENTDLQRAYVNCVIGGAIEAIQSERMGKQMIGPDPSRLGYPESSECRNKFSRFSIRKGLAPKTINDPYNTAKNLFTQWEGNPNSVMKEVSAWLRRLESVQAEFDRQLDRYAKIDVLGAHLGQRLEEFNKKFPSVSVQKHLEFSDKPLINHMKSNPGAFGFINETYGMIAGKNFSRINWDHPSHTEKFKDVDPIIMANLKRFSDTYNTAAPETRAMTDNAVNMLALFYVDYHRIRVPEEQLLEVTDLNLRSIELAVNLFGQITKLDIRRRLKGTINLDTLERKFRSKYANLTFEMRGGDSSSFGLVSRSENIDVGFYVYHEISNNEPTTNIQYSLEHRLDKRAMANALRPYIDAVISEYFESIDNNTKSASDIEI